MNSLAMARKKTKLMAQVIGELFYCQSKGEYTSKRRDKLFAKLWDMVQTALKILNDGYADNVVILKDSE